MNAQTFEKDLVEELNDHTFRFRDRYTLGYEILNCGHLVFFNFKVLVLVIVICFQFFLYGLQSLDFFPARSFNLSCGQAEFLIHGRLHQ